MASIFTLGVLMGTTILAEKPSSFAPKPTACPWLPADAVMTPLAFSSGVRCRSLFRVPLILKEWVAWWFSSFRYMLALQSSLRYFERFRGIALTYGAMVFCAFSMSWMVTMAITLKDR